MASYIMRFDESAGIVHFKVLDFIADAEAPVMGQALREVIDQAHAHGPLRLLWDNRESIPLSPSASEVATALFGMHGKPGDRVAVLVGNSMDKVRSRPKMLEGTALFASESAAFTWLDANQGQARRAVGA